MFVTLPIPTVGDHGYLGTQLCGHFFHFPPQSLVLITERAVTHGGKRKLREKVIMFGEEQTGLRFI